MDYGYIVKILGSLLLVILMMVALLYVMKRFSLKSGIGQGNLRILTALNIGPRERLMLVQAGKNQILVGSTPSSIRALHVLDDIIESDTDDGNDSRSMKEILASVLAKQMNKQKQGSADTGSHQNTQNGMDK